VGQGGAEVNQPQHRILWGTNSLIPLLGNEANLSFTSPPYAKQRKYGKLDFKLKGDAYVDWACQRLREQLRVTSGLVAWVLNGTTKDFTYDAVPEKIVVRMKEAGFGVRKSPIYYRHGIAGSGGPDWFRDDYEPVLCFQQRRGERLPWSDNIACGEPCKYAPGGKMTHRTASDKRVEHEESYTPPKIANPGNVQKVVVGGGHMGHALAHENEAPFSVKLAERYVRSFCPPGGIVLDAFAGSGTTAQACHEHGRRSISMDVRLSQCLLTQQRLLDVTGVLYPIEVAADGIEDAERPDNLVGVIGFMRDAA
jgi:hypothetical protein